MKFPRAALRLLLILTVATLGALSTACAGADSPTPTPHAGQLIYVEMDCARCHGALGEGGSGGPVVPVEGTVEEWTATMRAVHSRPYPPERLSDADIDNLFQWLSSLP